MSTPKFAYLQQDGTVEAPRCYQHLIKHFGVLAEQRVLQHSDHLIVVAVPNHIKCTDCVREEDVRHLYACLDARYVDPKNMSAGAN